MSFNKENINREVKLYNLPFFNYASLLLLPLLCGVAIPNMGNHVPPQLPLIYNSKNVHWIYLLIIFLVIHLHRLLKQVVLCFSLTLWPLIYPKSVEFSNPSFLVIYPRNVNYLYLIASISIIFIYRIFPRISWFLDKTTSKNKTDFHEFVLYL